MSFWKIFRHVVKLISLFGSGGNFFALGKCNDYDTFNVRFGFAQFDDHAKVFELIPFVFKGFGECGLGFFGRFIFGR